VKLELLLQLRSQIGAWENPVKIKQTGQKKFNQNINVWRF
jgi:hypothetical protein